MFYTQEEPEFRHTFPYSDSGTCRGCGKAEYEEGYQTHLCYDCRAQCLHLPVPVWIKAFAVGVITLTCIGLFRMPKFLEAGIHYARGLKAESHKKYATATREFERVTEAFPNSTENNVRYFLACYHSGQMEKMDWAYQKVVGQTIESDDLFQQVNTTIEGMNIFDRDTAFVRQVSKIKDDTSDAVIATYKERLVKAGHEVAVEFELADKLYDRGEYASADTLAREVLKKPPDAPQVLYLLYAINRELGKYDQAMVYCDHALALNAEDSVAIKGKIRLNAFKKEQPGETLSR
ncbi:MAG TPA: hypothetical protein VNZ86_00585 [Bacteroidia bacterium]|jgi:tetratricopeptide (TPR) repeat protein|nr:hypothetical protein [Bacteroidia bacterium]